MPSETESVESIIPEGSEGERVTAEEISAGVALAQVWAEKGIVSKEEVESLKSAQENLLKGVEISQFAIDALVSYANNAKTEEYIQSREYKLNTRMREIHSGEKLLQIERSTNTISEGVKSAFIALFGEDPERAIELANLYSKFCSAIYEESDVSNLQDFERVEAAFQAGVAIIHSRPMYSQNVHLQERREGIAAVEKYLTKK